MLVIASALGSIAVRASAEHWRMHEGKAPGGPLVEHAMTAANLRLHNRPLFPVLEVFGRVMLRAQQPIEVATDREPARMLAIGDELVVASEPRRVAYLAIAGGIRAAIGVPLRAGAILASNHGPPRANTAVIQPLAEGPIRIVPGPDHHAFEPAALAALVSAPYQISPTSDRIGTRLVGPRLTRNTTPDRTKPLVLGALEVPRDGQPIVLGVDHPTTGGYPILAVICHADLDRFHSIRLGGSVHFVVDDR